jgi:hypothetical protein
MANLVGGTIAQSNTDWNIPQVSGKVTIDALTHPFIATARSLGIINDESMQAAKKGKGDLIKMPNVYRLDSRGSNVNASLYGQAKTIEFGQRELRLGVYKDILEYDRDDTISIQRDSLGVLSKHDQQMLSEHVQNLLVVGMFNQLGGQAATSISAPDLSATAFSGDYLNNASLLTSVTAVSSDFTRYGSGTANANPSAITATNSLLTMQDFQYARTICTRTFGGVHRWNRLKKEYWGVAWVSESGHMQLMNQARASGADATLSQYRYSAMEGGRPFAGLNNFVVPELGLLFIIVPDQLMPRAAHSGTENALSRCAIITGGGALDFAVGSAYPSNDKPAFKIAIDDKTFSLDDKIYVGVKGIFAGKRVQFNGSGSLSGNSYEAATFVIRHSAAS